MTLRAGRRGCGGLLLLLAVAGGVDAQEEGLRDLRWMGGCWRAGEGDSSSEEIWTTPRGGLLLGLSRSVSPRGSTSFEFMRIQLGPQGVVFHASPGGQPSTAFSAVVADGERLRVERPEHDFPKAIEYRPVGTDSLVARVFGEVDTAEPAFALRFARVACPGKPS